MYQIPVMEGKVDLAEEESLLSKNISQLHLPISSKIIQYGLKFCPYYAILILRQVPMCPYFNIITNPKYTQP